jgi:hypothetical protein
MIKRVVGILGFIFLGACVGPNDRPPDSPELIELKNTSKSQCLENGHSEGSSKFNSCVSSLVSEGRAALYKGPEQIEDASIVQARNYCMAVGYKQGSNELANCTNGRLKERKQELIAQQKAQQQLGKDFMKMGAAGLSCSQYGAGAGYGAMFSGKCEPPPAPPVTVYTKAQPKNCKPNPYRPNELECDNGLICKPNPYRPSELECN